MLSKDEIKYELKFRGIDEDTTVERMRKYLRNLLGHEKSADKSFSFPAYNVPFEQEKSEIEKKIEKKSN